MSSWLEPGILFCLPPPTSEPPDVIAYYEGIGRLLTGREAPYVSISDVRRVRRLPTASERRLQAELANCLREAHPAPCLASVVIAESALVRATSRAISWLLETDIALHTVESMDEALDVARRLLGTR